MACHHAIDLIFFLRGLQQTTGFDGGAKTPLFPKVLWREGEKVVVQGEADDDAPRITLGWRGREISVIRAFSNVLETMVMV